ncbi:MAG TPA: hypothetical protein VFV99_00680 [Kofleriaceae bacterium]|nr:hypothetical protein [Kofleriaceae bacterium]
MRTLGSVCLFAAVFAAGCGDDDAVTPDTQTGNHPPPRVIPGGGIGDGAIDGVVNLYVIDNVSHAPISGATVRVGDIDGTTDATGLFIADGVVGPQTVLAKATGMRSEMWIGANGANMTLALETATAPTPTQANISGSITGFNTLTVPTGHNKTALISYSQDDKLGDAGNNIQTAGNQNICTTNQPTGGCTFTVTTRTGSVALLAAIYDHDTNGTPLNGNDDTFTLIGWATSSSLNVANGVDQTGIALTMVDVGNLANVTVTFGTPPTSLPNVAAIVGIELGAAGVFQLLPQILTPSAATVLAPKLAAFSGATYRLTAIANNGNAVTSASSAKLVRGQSTMSLDAGTWIDIASSLTLTRSGGSWSPVSGALIQGVEYELPDATQLLSVTSFDGSTSFTIPDVLALPASGTLIARGTAMMGTLDLQNFSLDSDFTKVTGFSAQPLQID